LPTPVAGAKFAANLFGFATDDPGRHPTLGAGVFQGFGIGNAFVDGLTHTVSSSFPDPAWKLVSDENAIVLDARTLSACIRMAYYGAMFTSAGQVGFVENVPLSLLIGHPDQDGLEHKEQPASVNDLFKLAARTQRMGTSTLEVLMRHTPGSELFQSSSDPAIFTHVLTDHPNPQFVGDFAEPSSAPRLGENADNFAATVFGFVWKNVTNPAALSFELVKNVEWRPSLDSGFQAVKPVSVAGSSYVDKAQEFLDKRVPEWRARTSEAVGTAADKIASIAFTGAVGAGMAALGRANRSRLGYQHGGSA
jgi:hypothetical protein